MVLLNEQCPAVIGECGAYMDRDIIFFGKFHGSDLQDFGSHTGHFQHLIVRDFVQFSGLGADIGVRGIYAVDICKDVADVRLWGRGHGHGTGIRTTASQGG